MTSATQKLFDVLDDFVWYRSDEQDDKMVDALAVHIKWQDARIEEMMSNKGMFASSNTTQYIEKLESLLRESRREHYHCDDSWYCCGKCLHPDHTYPFNREPNENDYLDSHGGEAARVSGQCNCGADAWNAKVDEALR